MDAKRSTWFTVGADTSYFLNQVSKVLSLFVPSLQRSEDRRGFTLIELLVVIAIIGILAALLVSNFSTARARARDASRTAYISQLNTAVARYLDDNDQANPATTAAAPPTTPPSHHDFVEANMLTIISKKNQAITIRTKLPPPCD